MRPRRCRAKRIASRPPERERQRSILADHRAVAGRSPFRYIHSLLLVARFSLPAWKRFFQAGPVARYCIEARVSHLHAGFAHAPASVAWWASRMTGIPFSFAAHAKDLYLSDRRSLLHKMDAARFVWTCTEANGAFLRSLGSVTPVHVGYHGCDLRKIAPDDSHTPRERAVEGEEAAAEAPVILGVGRHVPRRDSTTFSGRRPSCASRSTSASS
jgi:glycosyltransferase involved in cell wall biosynthesis